MARSTRDGEPHDGESGPMGVAPEPAPKTAKRVGIHLEDDGAIMGVNGLREALTEVSG